MKPPLLKFSYRFVRLQGTINGVRIEVNVNTKRINWHSVKELMHGWVRKWTLNWTKHSRHEYEIIPLTRWRVSSGFASFWNY